jgi:hypothetical protein
VEVRCCKTTPPVDDGFAGAVLPLTLEGRRERGLKTRVVEGVSAELPGLETGRLEPESQELLLHLGPARRYAAHPPCLSVAVHEFLEQKLRSPGRPQKA